jgi:AraC-like DNA-binding protein
MTETIDGLREAVLRTAGPERLDFEPTSWQNLLGGGVVSLRMFAPDTPTRHRRYAGPMFGIDEIEMTATAHFDATLSEGAIVVEVLDGTAHHCGDSAATSGVLEAENGQVFLAHAGVPLAIRVDARRLRIFVVEPTLLRRVVAQHPGTRSVDINFMASSLLSTNTVVKAWNRNTQFLFDSLCADDAPPSPLIVDACARVLAATVLTCFPNDSSIASVPTCSGATLPAQVGRAMSFVAENAHEDVGVQDIAGAVRLSPRAVQYLFRRYLDATPSEYLRRVRLDHAHRDLVAGDRTTTSVNDVAARWRFAHTGRFAMLYRQTYGQSPHLTLRE